MTERQTRAEGWEGERPGRRRPYRRPSVEELGAIDSVLLAFSVGVSDSSQSGSQDGRGPLPPQ